MTEHAAEVLPTPTELYTDLSDLPLYNWIELACTSNLKWLVKSGPIPLDLSDHYASLLAEYQILVKDTKSDIEHKTRVTYARLANRIDHITVAVNTLRIERDEELIRILQTPQPDGLGFERLSYDDLERDLKLTENYLKMDIVKFEQAKNQLGKMVKAAESSGAGNSKGVFYEQITSLSKWLQFGINPKECSVMQYISYLNMLDAEIRANRNKK